MIILNFANCDMVGHTGVFDAAKAAVEAVDTCVGRVAAPVDEMGGVLLITADHGNADKMVDTDGEPFTPHTTEPGSVLRRRLSVHAPRRRAGGYRAHDAEGHGSPQPEEMTGKSIIL